MHRMYSNKNQSTEAVAYDGRQKRRKRTDGQKVLNNNFILKGKLKAIQSYAMAIAIAIVKREWEWENPHKNAKWICTPIDWRTELLTRKDEKTNKMI